MKFNIRKARKSDSDEIIRLIRELAYFEKLVPPDDNDSKRLLKDAFSKNPRFKILVAEYNKKLVGYAFYFFTYSTFLARPTLYLEDIYISEKYRSKGLGKDLFLELKRIAQKEKCGRMEWIVLDWNRNAISFYEKLGAKVLEDWKFSRLTIT
jgi:GNAT superfamily N-acetyltransferase